MSLIKRLKPVLAECQRRYFTWRRATHYRSIIGGTPLPDGTGLDERTRAEALNFLGTLVRGYRDLRWHEIYARVGQPSPFYVPDDIIFSLAMPSLNPKDRTAILSDKNHFDLIEGWPALPVTVGRLMNGRLLDPHYRSATLEELSRQFQPTTQLVVKPTRTTGSGKGVVFIECSGLADALVGRTDAIIQLPVLQHRDLAVLNASSTNVMRITTYRKLSGEVVHLGSFQRVGRAGKRIDAGGLFCGIDPALGVLSVNAYSLGPLRTFQAHPDNGLLFGGRRVPGFAAARDAMIAAHAQFPWIGLASWDVAIDSAGRPVALEVNVGTSSYVQQIACGPIFAPVADDLRKRIGTRRYSRIAGFL